jgi:hypothetical protein
MYRVRTDIWGGITGPGVSTFYFDDTGGLTAQHAADAVTAFWQGVQGRMVNTVNMQVNPLVYHIDPATGAPTSTVPVFGTALAGFSSADPLPWTTQGLIESHTGLFAGGREIRGRLFIPGPDETNSTSGRPIAAYVTQLQVAAVALMNDTNSVWGVWSRKHGVFTAINGVSTWNNWAALRSRRD